MNERHRVAAMELQLTASRERPAYFHGLTMLPILREGDGVETAPVTPAEVRVGDVVTYRHLDRFPTRRVMAVDHDSGILLIQGDAMPDVEAVPFSDLLARVVARHRDGRRMATSHPLWRLTTARVLVRFWRRTSPSVAIPRRLWHRSRRWAAGMLR